MRRLDVPCAKLNVCVHVRTYVCMYVCMRELEVACASLYVCMHVCMYVCMYVMRELDVSHENLCLQVYIHTYIHTNMYSMQVYADKHKQTYT
jgi:hypothetical protein